MIEYNILETLNLNEVSLYMDGYNFLPIDEVVLMKKKLKLLTRRGVRTQILIDEINTMI